MNAAHAGTGFLVLGIIILAGKIIRIMSPPLQRLFIPSSLIGGFLALFLGPEVLGNIAARAGIESSLIAGGLFPDYILNVWSALPGLFINIIFACLFLGKKIPSLKEIWLVAGPQVAHGQAMAWGQYVFGILLTILVLTPFFSTSPMAGALIEIGFEGGHGTAAGMASTFEELGFKGGTDMAVGLATVGIFIGVVLGIILLNYGVRKGSSSILRDPAELRSDKLQQAGIIDFDSRESAGSITTRPESIEPLSLHLAYIAVAIAIGYALLQGVVFFEHAAWGRKTGVYLFRYIPLFPLAMIGGIIVEKTLDKFDAHKTLNRPLITRIQGLSLDILIASAIATLSLGVIGQNLIPFILLALIGIVWNVIAYVYLAPKMIPSYWFERGIGNFGQSMGMTASGLLLMKIADPENKTPALESFGYKQLLFEPVVGGGIFTAASVPLIFQFGPVFVLILAAVFMLFWLWLGIFHFGRK